MSHVGRIVLLLLPDCLPFGLVLSIFSNFFWGAIWFALPVEHGSGRFGLLERFLPLWLRSVQVLHTSYPEGQLYSWPGQKQNYLGAAAHSLSASDVWLSVICNTVFTADGGIGYVECSAADSNIWAKNVDGDKAHSKNSINCNWFSRGAVVEMVWKAKVVLSAFGRRGLD